MYKDLFRRMLGYDLTFIRYFFLKDRVGGGGFFLLITTDLLHVVVV
jgi:hypothetical protein